MSWSRREVVYAVALVVGIAVPLGVLAPWLADHGLDVPLLVKDLFATGVSSFFAADVIVAVLILMTAAALDRQLPPRSRVAVGVTSLLGASAGLPAYLLLRARATRTSTRQAD